MLGVRLGLGLVKWEASEPSLLFSKTRLTERKSSSMREWELTRKLLLMLLLLELKLLVL